MVCRVYESRLVSLGESGHPECLGREDRRERAPTRRRGRRHHRLESLNLFTSTIQVTASAERRAPSAERASER